MESRLTYYDVVAHLVPGALVLAVFALVPHVFKFQIPWPTSGLLSTATAVPLAYAVGQVVQGVASFMQPLYYRLWRGKPSSRMLAGNSSLLQEPRRARIVATLADFFDASAQTPQDREALFVDAMALCNREHLGRVDSFNASYAFHRALLTAGALSTIVLTISLIAAVSGADTYRAASAYLAILALALTAVEFVRARQRGEYFAAEVLNMAYLHANDLGRPAATGGGG